MTSMLKQFVKNQHWTQEQFADQINQFLDRNPHLKKKTTRNPNGIIDQVQVQRILSGTTPLDQRWLEILHGVLNKTPNEILGYPLRVTWLAPYTDFLNNAPDEYIKAITTLIEAFKSPYKPPK